MAIRKKQDWPFWILIFRASVKVIEPPEKSHLTCAPCAMRFMYMPSLIWMIPDGMLQVIDMLLEKLPEIVAEEEEAAGDGGRAGLNSEGSFSQVSGSRG